MTEQQKDPAQLTEAEQMQRNYDAQQEVASRKPVPHGPDVGTQQGFANATAEQRAYNEEHGIKDPTVTAEDPKPAPVTGASGGTAKAASKTTGR